MYNPLISVIIPTHDRPETLRKAIISVINQTYKNIEILVMTNNTTSETIDVIKNFNDIRIKIFDVKVIPNKNIIARARNEAFINCNGEYITFLDDDDLWCHDKLQIQLDFMETYLNFDMCYSNSYIINEKDKITGLLCNPKNLIEGDVFEELLKYNFIPILTVMLRNDTVMKTGLFSENINLINGEDYQYWLRVAVKGYIGAISKPLTMYRLHGNNLSKKYSGALARQNALKSLII